MLDAIVIGAGQAGLAMSHELHVRGIGHRVLERGRVGERWRSERWDSLAFQFPNWSLRLPGFAYDGDDPDGFAGALEIAARLERYAARTAPPLELGVTVTGLCRAGDAYRVETTDGTLAARAVVVATGPFQQPFVPVQAGGLPADIVQLHAAAYRAPAALPAGACLVVGSGGSGAQIAEDLAAAGRSVYLAVSPHRRVPRRHRGRDLLWWLNELGWMDRTFASLPGGRLPPTLLMTGVDGGRDLDLRRLHADGVTLLGRLHAVDGRTLRFADDAGRLLAAAEAGCAEFVAAADARAAERGLDAPAEEHDVGGAPQLDEAVTLDLRDAGITSVIWCTGYRLAFDWIDVPSLDGAGAPLQERGVTAHPGLCFLGLHWMHTFSSGTYFGVGADAAHVAGRLGAHLGAA